MKVNVSSLTQNNFSNHESSESSDDDNLGSSSSDSNDNPVYSTPNSNNPSVSQSIWKVLSPKTRRKTKLSLSMNSEPGLNNQLRKELGINISTEVHSNEVPKSNLNLLIDTFFLQEHITKLCPDKKRTITDPNTGDIVQLQFRMGSLRLLHEQFFLGGIQNFDLGEMITPAPHPNGEP